jgi:hypothetical protein
MNEQICRAPSKSPSSPTAAPQPATGRSMYLSSAKLQIIQQSPRQFTVPEGKFLDYPRIINQQKIVLALTLHQLDRPGLRDMFRHQQHSDHFGIYQEEQQQPEAAI